MCVRATKLFVRGEAVCKGAHPVYFKHIQQLFKKKMRKKKETRVETEEINFILIYLLFYLFTS